MEATYLRRKISPQSMYKSRSHKGLLAFSIESDPYGLEIGPNHHTLLQGSKNMARDKDFKRSNRLEIGEK